jgi:CelD/BcsL family acetyltransferase involved in cellulose biosynthesis
VLRGELLDDPRALELHRDAWDELAVASGRPYCAPGWMLSWWRHAAPEGARLRVAVALDAGELVGIAPCFGERRPAGVERLRLLAAPVSYPTEPLAARGREREVAGALATALAEAVPRPRLIALEGIPSGSPWPGALADAWPGRLRPRVRREHSVPAPAVTLSGAAYEDWLAAKSRNFRSQVRRARRGLEEAGGALRRIDDPEAIAEAVGELARLHHGRMERKGGSDVMEPTVETMLRAAARELAPAGRVWLWTVVADGAVAAALLFVAAGGVQSYWNGGFDDAFSDHRPGLQALVAAVEDGFERGLSVLDLGPGGQHYKSRLADREENLVSLSLGLRDARYPLTRLQLAPRELARRLPQEHRARLSRLAGRRRG